MRWNSVCVAGLVISGASVAFLWIPLSLLTLGGNSNETQSDEIVKMYVRAVCFVYIFGVFVSFLTPLGSLLHIPGLTIAVLFDWSTGGGIGVWTVLVAISAMGTGLILASMFIQLARFEPSGEVKPLPRLRTWVLGPRPEGAHIRLVVPGMPRAMKVVLLALLSACIVIVAAAFLYLTNYPVSSIDIEVVADVYTYGQVHVVVYIDGVAVIDRYLEPDPSTNESNRHASVYENWDVTAGEHIVAAHYTNSTSGVLDDDPEYVTELRILPFCAGRVQIGIGVGWV